MIGKYIIPFELADIATSALELAKGSYNEDELKAGLDDIEDAVSKLKYKLTKEETNNEH